MLRLLKFGIVGGSGALIGFGTMYLFTDILNIYYILSYIMSFCISVANNYLWNTLWTFRGSQGSVKGYSKYIGTSVFTLGVTTLLMYIFTSLIGLHHMVSLIIVTLCGFPINFILSKKIVWRTKTA
jgi:dolichol-phosphate mannosyltransferase